MNVLKRLMLAALLLGTVGAGPCELLDKTGDSDETEETDTETDTDDSACDALTCDHFLRISFLLAGMDTETFGVGAYTFSVVAPDESVYSIECDMATVEDGLLCTAGNLADLEVAIDSSYRKIYFLIHGAPPYLTLKLEYNGYLLVNQVMVPEYDLTYPNGEECDPVCYQGEDYLAVTLY